MLSEQELAVLVFVLSSFTYIVFSYIVLAGVCSGVCRCFA